MWLALADLTRDTEFGCDHDVSCEPKIDLGRESCHEESSIKEMVNEAQIFVGIYDRSVATKGYIPIQGPKRPDLNVEKPPVPVAH